MLAIQKKMEELVLDEDFRGNDFKIYLLMLSKLNWHNMLQVNKAELERKTGIPRQEILKSMKLLERKGIIFRGKGQQYQLNAEYGIKGANAERAVLANKQKTKLTIVKYK